MKYLKITLASIIFLMLVLVGNSYFISYKAQNQLYSKVDAIPKNKVGLLLGTSKYMPKGGINPYYAYRIDAAVALFNAGKIDFILISGDNAHISYNEPNTFKKDLVKRGIPADKIVLDYAGFRTLDSVVRAKAVFGQEHITIISQQFHNERALYIAQHFDLNAIAFNAQDVSNRYGLKTQIREYFARFKAFFDILLNVQPKFLGEQIVIG